MESNTKGENNMENMTIGQIVGAIGTLSVLAGFFFSIYKFIKNVVLDKIEKNKADIVELKREMKQEVKELKQEVGILKSEVKDSKEERLILLKAQLACLKGLKEQGCNGPVTQAINDIENYIITKSHD